MNTTAAVELELLLPSLATANATSVPTTFSDGSDNDETLALFDGFDLEVATALDIDALVGESSGDFAADADDFASPLATLHSSRYSSVGECGSASGSSGTVSPASSSQQTRKQKRHEQQCQSESSSHAISVATVPAPLTSKHTATASAAPRGPPPALRLKRPRKHNRIEILKLRDEVEELEARAAKLRQPADGASSEDKQASAQQAVARARTSRVSTAVAAQYTLRHGSSAARAADSNATASLRSVWLDVAVEQYAALQQAQSLNRRLRDAISSRLRVSSSMQELLSKQSAIHDAELLGAIPCAVDALDSSDLHESVETLFRESGLVSRTIECSSDASTASHTSRTKQDAACGPVFEVATNTRIACHVEALGHMLWRRITDNFNASWRPRWPPHQSPHMHVVHERRMQATLTTELGDIHIDGAAVVKKFAVAAQRVVVTVASKWRVHECDLMLRETSWIILSDAAIDTSELEMQSLHTAGAAAAHSRSQPPQPPPPPPPTSLYQTFYRLYGERADASSATGSSPFAAAPDERTRRIQEAATKNMGEHMREHLVRLQRAMLSEMSIAAVRNVPFQVPAIECPY